MAVRPYNEKTIMKRTAVVDPFELCRFIETKYGIGNMVASNMTSYVTPECEVKTFHYRQAEIQSEIEECPEEEASYPEWPVSPNQMLLDFMTAHDITEFILTQ